MFKGNYKNKVSRKTRSMLERVFKSDIQNMKKLTGVKV